MKNLKNVKGAKQLSKNEQKSVKGGLQGCKYDWECPAGFYCSYNGCRRGERP